MTPRSREQRIADARAMLAKGGDAWLATAGAEGPHLVPLTLAWDDAAGEVVFCTEKTSRSVRNIESCPEVRVAVGKTRDVVLIRGTARLADDPATAELYRAAADWDPGGDPAFVYLRVTPVVCDAWREVDEMPGRRVMVGGQWRDGLIP